MTYTLYVAEFPHGKKYFGITSGPLEKRINGHRTRANCGSPFPFHAALRKYGCAVQFKTIFEGERGAILQMEIDAIREGRTQDREFGYNVTPGGDDSPMLTPGVAEKVAAAQRGRKRNPRSEEAKAKTSASLKVAYAEGRKVSISPMAGRKHSDETRARMREKALGRVISESQRAATSAFHLGRKHSEETKQKRSESARRHWESAEARADLGEKISAGIAAKGGRKGRVFFSDETRAKLSEATRKYWAARREGSNLRG